MGRYNKLAIIIPAYNEGESIQKVITRLEELADVIVVNDCSKDDTEKNARSTKAIVLNNLTNLGYEGSLRKGFSYAFDAGYDYFVTCDADGQHRPEDIEEACRLISDQDLVIGERETHARFAESVFSFYTNHKYNIQDPLSGLKAYSRKGFMLLGTFSRFDSIGTDLAITIVRAKLPYKTFKIQIQKREFGNSRFGLFLKPNIKILKALFKNLN